MIEKNEVTDQKKIGLAGEFCGSKESVGEDV